MQLKELFKKVLKEKLFEKNIQNITDKNISEDDEKKFEKIIQNFTDNHIKIIDEKVASKEKEIMTI